MEDLVTALMAQVSITLSFCLKHSVKRKTILKMKRICPFALSLWLINRMGTLSCVNFPYLYIVARRDFSYHSFSIMLSNGASIREYEASSLAY